MCKFELLQKDESRWQLTDSSKAYRNTSAFKCLSAILLLYTLQIWYKESLDLLSVCGD